MSTPQDFVLAFSVLTFLAEDLSLFALRGPLIICFHLIVIYLLFCTRASLVKMKRLRHFLSYRNIVRENRLPSYLISIQGMAKFAENSEKKQPFGFK